MWKRVTNIQTLGEPSLLITTSGSWRYNMPEIETYKFSHKELLELLVNASGIHEGKWQLQANFGFTAGNFGPDNESVNPGAMVILNHVGLTKARPDSPSGLTVDAEMVNPKVATA